MSAPTIDDLTSPEKSVEEELRMQTADMSRTLKHMLSKMQVDLREELLEDMRQINAEAQANLRASMTANPPIPKGISHCWCEI